jgi:pilus assembly protein CpaE
MAITVLVADAKGGTRQELVTQLRRDRGLDVIADTSDAREVVELTRTHRPGVVLLDGSVSGATSAGSVVEQINGASPETGIVALVEEADVDLLRHLMRAGVRDCLIKPVPPEELLNTIRNVHNTMQKQREVLGIPGSAGATTGKVIAVYSPQGGSGKSVIAANLAVEMAKTLGTAENKGRVALVDLNLQFGDIDLMLNLNPTNTIAGLAQKGHTGLDAELVDGFLTVHSESGLRVLVAPSTPQYAESVTVYTVEQVIETLRDSYQFVVVDTPSQLQDTTLSVLDAANIILLITTLDLLALHKTRTALDMLRQLYPADKIQLVLNRANSEAGITVSDVEAALSGPMRMQIPSDGRLVVTSINEGKPFVLSSPNSVISRRVHALAMDLLGREPLPSENNSSEAKGGLLGWLFKD